MILNHNINNTVEDNNCTLTAQSFSFKRIMNILKENETMKIAYNIDYDNDKHEHAELDAFIT